MADKAKKMELEDGKVYLRDTRNGRIHQYEDTLAQMSYMHRFVAGEDPVPKTQELAGAGFNVSLTGLERAAEWDKRAQMSNKEREAYDRSRNNAGTNDVVGVQTTASGQPASAPQTLTAPADTSGATPTKEGGERAATAQPAAPATASGAASTPAAPPAPPAPPKQGDKADTAAEKK